jgi:hypothetical protein
MPRAGPKPKLDPNARYRAWTSMASDYPIRGLVITKGMRFKGDHPFVKQFPHLFVHDGTDPDTDAERELQTRWLQQNGDGNDA